MSDPKEEEKKTLNENDHSDKKNPEDEGEKSNEEVQLTPEEIAKLKKKAADFDGMVERQRLAKLNKKDEDSNKGDEDVKATLKEINEKLAIIEREKAESALREAYKEFSTSMPWANDSEYFDKISEEFSHDGSTSKEVLVSKLKAIAISKFPDKYSEFEEKKIKSKVLADTTNINNGSGGVGGKNEAGEDVNKKQTQEEQIKAKMSSLLAKFKNPR